jgi:hypothetical protein
VEDLTQNALLRLSYYTASSFNNYLSYGARSPKKLLPLHGEIGRELRILSGGVVTFEEKVEGAYFTKRCDIAVSCRLKRVTGVVAVKFPISNFKQNANNYFEGSLGETANLREANIKVGHFILLPFKLPYLDENKIVKKIETITDEDIKKYRKLMSSGSVVSPTCLFFQLVNVWGDRLVVGQPAPKKRLICVNFYRSFSGMGFSPESEKFLKSVGDYKNFLNKLSS